MSLATKLKAFKPLELAAIAFYVVSAIILLAFLPLTGYAPHLGFLAILGLITAYSLFTKRAWAPWLVGAVFIVNSGFALVTLYSIGFSNVLVALGMTGYAVLTWMCTAYLLLKKAD